MQLCCKSHIFQVQINKEANFSAPQNVCTIKKYQKKEEVFMQKKKKNRRERAMRTNNNYNE